MASLKNTTINDTGYLRLPQGNTGQRAQNGAGSIRYNTESSQTEIFDGTNWNRVSVVAPPFPPGQSQYTSPGTYTWTAPAGVTSVNALAIGGGGGGWDNWAQPGGAGAGLGWKNNITTIPGTGYTVVVGGGGGNASNGGTSYFQSPSTVAGYGGGSGGGGQTGGPNGNGRGGGYIGDGGGAGGNATDWTGGGGAGGYTGRGGNLGESAPSGGGAAGGRNYSSTYGTGGGGGVGIFGQGSPGVGFYTPWEGTNSPGGGGNPGSGGSRGAYGENPWSGTGESSNNLYGGAYGGGGGGPGTSWPAASGDGATGAVRIIWGTTVSRSWPSTNTGNL